MGVLRDCQTECATMLLQNKLTDPVEIDIIEVSLLTCLQFSHINRKLILNPKKNIRIFQRSQRFNRPGSSSVLDEEEKPAEPVEEVGIAKSFPIFKII